MTSPSQPRQFRPQSAWVSAVGDLGEEPDSVTGKNYTSDGVFWQVMIHVVFIVSAIALAWIDKI